MGGTGRTGECERGFFDGRGKIMLVDEGTDGEDEVDGSAERGGDPRGVFAREPLMSASRRRRCCSAMTPTMRRRSLG